MRVSFRIKLLASHAAVALAVSAVALLVVDRAVSSRMEAQVDRRLEAQARSVATWMERAGHPHRLASRLSGVVGARVTILDEDGNAVGESRRTEDGMADVASEGSAPEVDAARGGNVGRATRFSKADQEQIRYIAVPTEYGAVVRLGFPIGEIDETKSDIRRQLAVGALASLVVALALAFVVAGPLTRRLRDAQSMAQRIGAGDYDVTLTSESRDEIGVLSRTLVTAASELKEADARRREFLANVAHEIRTPVTSIRGYAETLESSDVDSETRSEFLQTIHRNAIRVGRLVEDLLELEALQAGKGRALERETVVLATIFKNVASTLQATTSELEARVDTDVPPKLAATGDADAVERILLNLVGNALRHGGRGVAVNVAATKRGDRVVVTVSDNGAGIPEDQRHRIFERFHRGDGGERDGGGSGLGLAIARELSRAMNGSLALAEASEHGATFVLELPA